MKITKLILHNYKRFFLNSIQTLTYTPKQHIGFILGSNGSGKSSLLSNLNPLPANITNDYHAGGYKYIEISHNNKEYIISSGYLEDRLHSFVCDGEELNIAGKVKVQKQLVEEHFNLTTENNNILLGLTKFTSMSTADRKKWFTEISHLDYEYALSVYGKLKQRHRDITGAIKVLQEEAIKIKAMVIDNSELDRYREEAVMIEETIVYLSSLYEHNIKNLTVSEDDIRLTNIEVDKLYRADAGHNTIDKLNLAISNIESRLPYLDKEITSVNEEIDIKHKNIASMEKTVNLIREDKNALLEEKNKILTIFDSIKYTPLTEQQLEEVIVTITNMLPQVHSLCDTLTEHNGVVANREVITNLSNKIIELTKGTNLLNSTIKDITNDILEYKKNNQEVDVTCDNCHTSWKVNTTLDMVTILNGKLVKANLEYNKQLEELTVLKANYKKLYDIYTARTTIMQLLATSTLHGVFNNLSEEGIVNTSTILNTISQIQKMIPLNNRLLTIDKHIQEYSNMVDGIAYSKEQLSTLYTDGIPTLEAKLAKLTEEKVDKTATLRKLLADKEYVVKMGSLFLKLKKMLMDIHKQKELEVKHIKNNTILELIGSLKTALASTRLLVQSNDEHISKLAGITDKVSLLSNKEKVLAAMVKELSPTEGLIATSINGFLNLFIKEMNTIINSIWSYNMTILPCDVEEGELDYKFKVLVDNNETIEDISLLSSSMQEIVNLAYVICFIKYSGIINPPLILDEVGRTMDSKHRTNIYEVISSVISSNFQQVFIVSHYESTYGRFVNADISVLDSTNIDVDGYKDVNNVLTYTKV